MSNDVAGMNPQPTLERWEHRAEWPLAAVAVVFLAAYSLEVLAQPQGNNAASSKCILALSYPYLNGVLGSAGFFDQASKTGLWISGDYQGHDWLPKNGAGQRLTERWAKLQKRQKTNFAGTAFQVARLVTLLGQGKLVNPASSSDMLLLTTGADGIGSYIQTGLATAPRSFLRVFSKIGFGNDSVSHDCAFVRVNDGGGDPAKAIKYVAVVLGSPLDKSRTDLRKLTVAYHDCVLSRHP
jgi:Beta-lactamase enzyme family